MEEMKHAAFLAAQPPSSEARISDLTKTDGRGIRVISRPDVELYCKNCQGNRYFASADNDIYVGENKVIERFLTYFCRNCRMAFKTFAVSYSQDEESKQWRAVKYGEQPPFGPHTPSRTISLIGPDRDEFLQGRRCESQGLGVAAFVYYRRVVERQKNRLLDQISNVASHVGGNEELVAEIEKAKSETQFTKAVESIKHAIPQSLLINGQNPLTLLYNALSQGVHNLSDRQCLALAHSVRVVLVEFSEKVAAAIKNEDELNNAIKMLQKPGGA